MKLRQNVARLKHFSNRFTDSITRTTHRPSRTILIIDNWARNLYFITHTQFGSHSGKKCLRFGGKKKKKERRDYLRFPKFSQQHLSLHFSALLSWVQVGTLPLPVRSLPESRQKDDEGHDENEDERLPLCWSHVKLSLRPFVFPLCLKRPKEKHTGPVRYRRTPQQQNNRSHSELCPYVCDICCTCMYFKS